jgi:hypothetical protein
MITICCCCVYVYKLLMCITLALPPHLCSLTAPGNPESTVQKVWLQQNRLTHRSGQERQVPSSTGLKPEFIAAGFGYAQRVRMNRGTTLYVVSLPSLPLVKRHCIFLSLPPYSVVPRFVAIPCAYPLAFRHCRRFNYPSLRYLDVSAHITAWLLRKFWKERAFGSAPFVLHRYEGEACTLHILFSPFAFLIFKYWSAFVYLLAAAIKSVRPIQIGEIVGNRGHASNRNFAHSKFNGCFQIEKIF